MAAMPPAAAVRRQPQARRLAAVGLKSASMPPNFGIGMVLRGRTLGIWGYGKIGRWWPATAAPSA